jgi:hypothetical protein
MGIREDQIARQLEMFKKGAAPVKLVKAATVNDGIAAFNEKEQESLIAFFSQACEDFKIIKFVPASGAATRMFKTLLYFDDRLDKIDEDDVRKRAEKDETDYKVLLEVLEGIRDRKFAFQGDLEEKMAKAALNLENLIKKGHYKDILNYLLTGRGLNYASLPKALLKFHRYEGYSRTALEEHLVEGLAYSKDKYGTVHIHFTLSPEFRQKVDDHIASVIHRYEQEGVTFDLGFSEQKTSTNTAAVDQDNNLFRDNGGRLVLRPGGHGALIENLNELDGDIIFIKNIDNVVPDRLKEETIRYKKILGGYLVKLQSDIFSFLERLSAANTTEEEIKTITAFAQEKLNIYFPAGFPGWTAEEKQAFLVNKLNRPLRVCGMVKNEGEPGGGPFFVEGRDKTLSLQIVEGAQVDNNSQEQVHILKHATHFNPVDLVCGIRDFRGNKFNLTEFVDPEAYFIANKSFQGRSLKALELPGLWNGAMADWITIFVEVPIITFNPIKTVNDLLRKSHTGDPE